MGKEQVECENDYLDASFASLSVFLVFAVTCFAVRVERLVSCVLFDLETENSSSHFLFASRLQVFGTHEGVEDHS